MTSAFGGQRSIQLSYGCKTDSHSRERFLTDHERWFNGEIALFTLIVKKKS